MNKINIYQVGAPNVGDAISKPIVEHILKKEVNCVKKEVPNKIICIGSVLSWAIAEGDTVWGSGLMSNCTKVFPKYKVIALRGPLTAKSLNSECKVFGDPALLLPLVYHPTIRPIHELGIVEHYVDRGLYQGEGLRINPLQNYKLFVDQIKSCKRVISSSLHGIIIAEAYGIPSDWVKLSNGVGGGSFKFMDYLEGTGRTAFSQPFDLKCIQDKLIEVLEAEVNENNTKN